MGEESAPLKRQLFWKEMENETEENKNNSGSGRGPDYVLRGV
jgi:hypothetical protein